jgi:hypothetical protein
LSSTLGKVGKAAAVGLGVGVVLAGKALVDMTKNAVEDDAAQRKLAIALKNATGATSDQVAAVEDWISAQGKALGVTDDELRPAFQRLVEATGSIEEAQRQMGIAMDVSAGTGKSLKTVTEALMKANNGTTASLSKLGLKTKDAEGNTLSLDEALKTMGNTFEGQAAAKANTLEGKMGRLKLIFDETKETIGSKLIPVLTNVADWFLNQGLPAVSAFGGWLRDNLGPIFERIRDVISSVMGGMKGDVGNNLGKIQQIFTDVTTIITTLWDRFGGIITDYAVKTFQNVKQIIGGALTVVQGIFQTFAALLQGDWSGAWDGIKKILSGAWEVIKGLVKQAMNVVGTLMEIGWSAVKGIVGSVWDGIKTVISNGISTVVGWISDLPGKLRDKVGSFKDAGAALIGGVVDGMKNAAGVIEGIAGNVWNAVRSLLNAAIDKINAALEFTIDLPGPDLTINPANIPHLAKGGLVNRPTLALIGEDGPEAVVPLSRKHNPGGVMPGGGVTNVFYLSGIIDADDAARKIEQLLIRRSRDVGPLAFTTGG